MNVLIFNWRDILNPQKGGAEIIIYELAKRLIEKGHRVTWFSESFPGGKKEEVVNGIRVIRRGGKFSIYFHAFLYYRSLKIKPDIVMECVNTICWQTPLYVERSRRIFYTNQAAREVFFYEYPFPFSVIGYLLEPLQYLTYRSTYTICYSKSIKDDLISFGLPAKNIHVFSLGLDHARYAPGKKSADPTFIFVGRFVRYKRPAVCIEAMQYVTKLHQNAKLFLVGYGKDEQRLQEQIISLNLSKSVYIVNKNNVFLNRDIRDDKVRHMKKAWGHLLLSVKEGWGMVVTEAAACATPSIVSDVTGLRDSVLDKKTGFILKKNPLPKEVAAAINAIIEDQKMRERFFQNATTFAKKFTWENSFKEFYTFVKDAGSYADK